MHNHTSFLELRCSKADINILYDLTDPRSINIHLGISVALSDCCIVATKQISTSCLLKTLLKSIQYTNIVLFKKIGSTKLTSVLNIPLDGSSVVFDTPVVDS